MKLKEATSYLFAVCLCAWYLLSVSGIDIHTDVHDDRSYVVPLFSGISCERIHPEDDCHCCHIHKHLHSCECELETEDCSDKICTTDITGFAVPQLHCPAAAATPARLALFSFQAGTPFRIGQPFRLFCGPPPDILREICILKA